MGNVPLTQQSDFVKLNNICYSLITRNNTFIDPKYTLNLNKYSKEELNNIHKSLGLNPQSKTETIKSITQYYTTIFNIIITVVNVYDLEGGGKYSITGIIQRNIALTNGILKISFCKEEQFDYINNTRISGVNFNKLRGINKLSLIMNNSELLTFEKHLKELFKHRDKRYEELETSVCDMDTTFNTQTFRDIYENTKGIYMDCKKYKRFNNVKNTQPDFIMSIPTFSPIFENNKCINKQSIVFNLDNKQFRKYNKKLYFLYNLLIENYNTNVSDVINTLTKILNINNNKGPQRGGGLEQVIYDVSIKIVTMKELNIIVKELKIVIMKLYVQSLLDYYNLIDYALTLKGVIMH